LASASASASKLWPRPQTFGLGLASISLSYCVIGYFSGKNRVKFGNFVNFSGNNLKLYVVNHYLVHFYRAMHFSAKRGIAIACRLSVRPSVCDVGEL